MSATRLRIKFEIGIADNDPFTTVSLNVLDLLGEGTHGFDCERHHGPDELRPIGDLETMPDSLNPRSYHEWHVESDEFAFRCPMVVLNRRSSLGKCSSTGPNFSVQSDTFREFVQNPFWCFDEFLP